MTCLYRVTTNFPQLGGAETELRTNDIYHALDVYLDEVQNGNPVMVVSGLTEEVLAIANHENTANHTTDEFGLIIRGYQAILAAQEKELTEKEETPHSDCSHGCMVLTLDFGEGWR